MPPSERKVLIIAPHYAPAGRPRAYRWTAVAEYLQQSGFEVVVLTSRPPSAGRGKGRINGVEVVRTGYASIKEMVYGILPKLRNRGIQRHFGSDDWKKARSAASIEPETKIAAFLRTFERPEGFHQGRTGRLLLWLNNTFWRSVYWPDEACTWYFPALWRARQLWREYGSFQAVISVSMPFTAHLIALALRKKRDFKWIVDIGDPFFLQQRYPVNNPVLYKNWNFRAESRVLQLSDTVTVTHEQVRKAYIQAFSLAAHAVTVIPPLGLPSLTEDKRKIMDEIAKWSSDAGEKTFHLGYFGSFSPGIRTPEHFLDFVEAWFRRDSGMRQRVQLHFFGDIFETFLPVFASRSALREHMHRYGLVPRETVPIFMESMDMLLHIGNQSGLHLPSKSADYLSSGKPILHFSYTSDDPFVAFAGRETPFFAVRYAAEGYADASLDALSAFVGHCVGLRKGSDIKHPLSTGHTAGAALRQYAELLE